jgi:hypothetical protein
MAELKTKKTNASVSDFVKNISDETQRKDAATLLAMMKKATKSEPKIWGTSIIGFGDYHYKYASGREGDWFVMGFAPRKGNMTIYFMCGLDVNADLLAKLGKFKRGGGCLYVKCLADIDIKVLQQLMNNAAKKKFVSSH